MIKAEWTNADALNLQPTCNNLATDCISRQAAIDSIRRIKVNYCETADDQILLIDKAMAMTELMMLPSAQPERKTGRWIKHKDRSCWYCSECNVDDYYAYSWNCDTGEYEFQDNYCPNCGCKMEVEHE